MTLSKDYVVWKNNYLLNVGSKTLDIKFLLSFISFNIYNNYK